LSKFLCLFDTNKIRFSGTLKGLPNADKWMMQNLRNPAMTKSLCIGATWDGHASKNN